MDVSFPSFIHVALLLLSNVYVTRLLRSFLHLWTVAVLPSPSGGDAPRWLRPYGGPRRLVAATGGLGPVLFLFPSASWGALPSLGPRPGPHPDSPKLFLSRS